ncbi:MAG: endolytic transglycosylase MltG [Peptococcaceae bacterium]|nr:endolytic transglycosylase MltG [Peptococcaceae bacterium]
MRSRRGNQRLLIKKGFKTTILILLLVLAGAGFWFSYNLKPVSSAAQTQVFVIEQGMSASKVAEELKKQNIIRSAPAFLQLCRWQNADSKLMAGMYYLSPGMSSREILETLLQGTEPEVVRITIPEGYTVEQIVNTLVNNGLGTEKEYYKVMASFSAKDYAFLAGIPNGKNRLEGFLFPDTYFFDKNAKARDVVDRFLERFSRELTPETKNKLEEMDLSIYHWLIHASIVEREAQKQEERPVIAGVFANRLRIGMPLQSCATVQYVLGEAKPVLSIEDTKIDSPYNTYKYPGLPPGPISNPGHASLQAVLYPEKTDYLYFVAKQDGSHAFAVTYQQHLNNVAKYQ